MTRLADNPASDPPGYDKSPVSAGAIFNFIFGFIISGILILLGLWWLEAGMAGRANTPFLPQSRELSQPLQPSPGHPTLPWQDMAAMRRAQEEHLNSYGRWQNDPQHARIPIDRAIDLLLQSGELQKPWTNPATQPFQVETQPAPRAKPSVENRT